MSSENLFGNLERHLRTRDDIEMMLLKGHLILEQALNQVLLGYVTSEKSLRELNLMFSKKLDLVVAISGNGYLPDRIAQLREINRIRNKLAHHLDFTDFHTDLKRWACNVLAYTPKTIGRKRTYRNTLMKAFYLLAGMLSGMAIGRVEALKGERSNNSFKADGFAAA